MLMRIGSSIGLIAIGLILALAVNVDLGGIDLELIGWIIVVVGVVGLVASLAMVRQSRTVVATREDPYAAPPTRVVREEAPTRVVREDPYAAPPPRDRRY
jgi:predicted MFS family arabinose efflux permease